MNESTGLMPIYNNITLKNKHVATAPLGHEDGKPFLVRADAEVHDMMGEVIIHSVRRPDGTNIMLTPEGTDKVKREVQLRSESNDDPLASCKPPRHGMGDLRMDADVERGMFG